MRSKYTFQAVTLTILLVVASNGWADFTNGDFSGHDTDWTVPPSWYDVDGRYQESDGGPVHYVITYRPLGEDGQPANYTIDQDVAMFDGQLASLWESPVYDEQGYSYTGFEQSFLLESGATCLGFRFAPSWILPTETDVFRIELYDSGSSLVSELDIASTEDTDSDLLARGYEQDLDGWWRVNLDLTADPFHLTAGTDYTLRFVFRGELDDMENGVLIDDVGMGVCSVVPTPGAVLLGSIGLGYAGLRLKRRNTASA